MKSLSVDALTITSRWPIMRAASSRSLVSESFSGLAGFIKAASNASPGSNSRATWSCLASSVPLNTLIPVTLPPGRLNPSTSPNLIGSPPVVNTIGTVVVAAFAASAEEVADNHSHRPVNQIGHQCRQPIELIVGPAVFNRDILALYEAHFLQALAERGHEVRRVWRADVLRTNPTTGTDVCCARRRERPHGSRTTEQRYELAPSHHSITSSARASSVGGISRPRALAVCMLMMSSNLVALITGKSAGLSPLRARPV